MEAIKPLRHSISDVHFCDFKQDRLKELNDSQVYSWICVQGYYSEINKNNRAFVPTFKMENKITLENQTVYLVFLDLYWQRNFHYPKIAVTRTKFTGHE